ncbi:hypothetical protein MFIFM68171_07601 [Madurella fahalii]|uniref:Uncharacterized protein n=1 Tax=Madurella fahalii TaxID=1157608 RepID=A0ABQ0GI35_9PEZI
MPHIRQHPGKAPGPACPSRTALSSALFGRAKTPAEARTALEVYDKIRRPRTQLIVKSSRGTGEIVTGRGEDTGLDLGKLKERLLPRWDFILNLDVKKHRDEAVEILIAELEKEKGARP